MPAPNRTRQSRTRQSGCTASVAFCLAMLTGCQSFSPRSSFARMRVIDLSPDAGSVDVYQGNNSVAYNLSYGAVTSYVSLAPGASTVTVDLAGSKQILSVGKVNFVAGAQYTLLLHNPVASLQQALLTDQLPGMGAPGPSVRLIHQAPNAGAVDVYLVPSGQQVAGIHPVATHLAPGAVSGYLPIPAGTFSVVMLPAGTIPSSATGVMHAGAQIEYANGSTHSLILVDGPANLVPQVQVIATVDAEPVN